MTYMNKNSRPTPHHVQNCNKKPFPESNQPTLIKIQNTKETKVTVHIEPLISPPILCHRNSVYLILPLTLLRPLSKEQPASPTDPIDI